jgi:hypothetical protein
MSSAFPKSRPPSLSDAENSNHTGDLALLPTIFDKTVFTTEYTPPPSSQFSKYSPRDLLQHSFLHGVQIDESPFFFAWCLWIVTVLWCFITLYYAHNATLSNPNEHLIPDNSEWTIGILNFMSTGSALLLTVLASTVLNRMRWVLATQPNGVEFKNFIGMSPATNVFGVLGLLFSDKGKLGKREGWLTQRCVSLKFH